MGAESIFGAVRSGPGTDAPAKYKAKNPAWFLTRSTYGYDPNRNLTSITGTTTPWYSQAFTYDPLNRLTGATGRYGTIGYTYDDVGNRLARDTNGTIETYSYFTGTNRLQEVTGGQTPRSFAYDDNGNITADGTRTFIYDRNNRLVGVEEGTNTVASYTYNGLGQRVMKAAGGVTTLFHYDMDGRLIAEGLPDGTITREYLYMGKVRLAMVDVASGKMYQIHNDRLGTPELMTDDTGTVVWEAWYEPFGKAHVHPNSNVVNNLRFPGQYADAETGLHYNYHRYYDPTTGRYLTPDPIGQLGGINLYSYVLNNPTNAIDPGGLLTGVEALPFLGAGGLGAVGTATVWTGGALAAGATGYLGTSWLIKDTWLGKGGIGELVFDLTHPMARSKIIVGPWPDSREKAKADAEAWPDASDWRGQCIRLYDLCINQGWSGNCGHCLNKCTAQQEWPWEDCSPTKGGCE